MPPSTQNRIEGLLLGTAVGDALGLPMEGMKPATIEQLGWMKNLRHRFIFARGMWRILCIVYSQSILCRKQLVSSDESEGCKGNSEI
ncbi:MAG: ADP-ribosylglycohydrolase family protein [Verrucomicrobiales bacterium]|nr:ADP-ribosylglycohydrolase family protein [Verrucomicrobiales bacterium]